MLLTSIGLNELGSTHPSAGMGNVYVLDERRVLDGKPGGFKARQRALSCFYSPWCCERE